MKQYIKPNMKVFSTSLHCLGPSASDAGDPTVGGANASFFDSNDDADNSSASSVWDDNNEDAAE